MTVCAEEYALVSTSPFDRFVDACGAAASLNTVGSSQHSHTVEGIRPGDQNNVVSTVAVHRCSECVGNER